MSHLTPFGVVSLCRLQVVVNYVAMTPEGRVFENSLEKQPFDIRVGAGQVLPGLDEGLLSMKVSRRGPQSLVAVHTTCWEWGCGLLAACS